MLKKIGIIAGVLGTVVLLLAGILALIGRNMCSNGEISTIPISGSDYKIVVFSRDCGATTSFSTQTSMIKKSERLGNTGGNIFIADDNHGAAPTTPNSGPELRVKVITPNLVELSYHKDARVFMAQRTFKGIEVRYSTFALKTTSAIN